MFNGVVGGNCAGIHMHNVKLCSSFLRGLSDSCYTLYACARIRVNHIWPAALILTSALISDPSLCFFSFIPSHLNELIVIKEREMSKE